MSAPQGFAWTRRKNGDVFISHGGRPATTLRGRRAAEFVDSIAAATTAEGEQQLMARLTGNYKRGNERRARNHPRNR